MSTGLELARATPEAREAYLRALVDAGAQALVLELVQWLREVPEEMLRTGRLMDFPLIVFREEVRFAELTKGAHESILRPHTPPDAEHGLDGLLDALVETGRSTRFLEEQLGPILSLPGRPRGTLWPHSRPCSIASSTWPRPRAAWECAARACTTGWNSFAACSAIWTPRAGAWGSSWRWSCSNERRRRRDKSPTSSFDSVSRRPHPPATAV